MDREFLRFYNQELAILREQAAEFADDYPGIAERLGGLVGDAADPMISGPSRGRRVPGSPRPAQAQARVRRFHHEPHRPARAALSRADPFLRSRPGAKPKFGDPALRDGRTIEQGAVFEATYREAQRNVACRFTLAEPITLWPFDIVKAEYLTSSGAFQALVPNAGVGCAASLQASAHRAKRHGGGRRARGQGSADPPGAAILVLPGEVAALPSARPGNRCGRDVRAAVRALHRRLFSYARRFRRSGHLARRAPT